MLIAIFVLLTIQLLVLVLLVRVAYTINDNLCKGLVGLSRQLEREKKP